MHVCVEAMDANPYLAHLLSGQRQLVDIDLAAVSDADNVVHPSKAELVEEARRGCIRAARLAHRGCLLRRGACADGRVSMLTMGSAGGNCRHWFVEGLQRWRDVYNAWYSQPTPGGVGRWRGSALFIANRRVVGHVGC